MNSSSLPARPVYTQVTHAVARAADMATQAYGQGTFSVGGTLLDPLGNELNAIHNNVVVNGLTHDPTAHGERQLIDWYYAQLAQGITLPPPAEMTIVTSLDPCCMCSGAILAAGFKVVSGAFDDFAGINYNRQASFPSLSPGLRRQAQTRYTYPAVTGSARGFARPATGTALSTPFAAGQTVDQADVALCQALFQATVNQVKNTINTDLAADRLCDPATLPADDPLILALKAIDPAALTYRAPARGLPDAGLATHLQAAARVDLVQGGSGNAVALLDTFGNLLLCMPGHEHISPLQTAFMCLTRNYAALREQLINNPAVGAEKTRRYLGHPKHGTWVFAKGPDDSARSLMELGAFGSTMEGAVPAENPVPLQYVVPSMSPTALTAWCQQLPPFYSRCVVVNPLQVQNQALIAAMMPRP